MPLGGAGVPWYGDIALTLQTAATYKQDSISLGICSQQYGFGPSSIIRYRPRGGDTLRLGK